MAAIALGAASTRFGTQTTELQNRMRHWSTSGVRGMLRKTGRNDSPTTLTSSGNGTGRPCELARTHGPISCWGGCAHVAAAQQTHLEKCSSFLEHAGCSERAEHAPADGTVATDVCSMQW